MATLSASLTSKPLTEGPRKGGRNTVSKNFKRPEPARSVQAGQAQETRSGTHTAKTLLEVIAEAARDPHVDVEKMQALLKMKRTRGRSPIRNYFQQCARGRKRKNANSGQGHQRQPRHCLYKTGNRQSRPRPDPQGERFHNFLRDG